MSAKLRILSLKLMEKMQNNQNLAQKIGVEWSWSKENSVKNIVYDSKEKK